MSDSVLPPRLALALAAALFALYPTLRPYSDESSLAGAAALASPWWTASHVSAMIALALLVVALVGMRPVVARREAGAALGLAFAGVCLVLPYYGAETFGVAAVGTAALERGDAALLAVADTVRFAPAPAAIFLLGLVALAAAGVLLALAVARSGWATWWAGWPLAVALVLFLPQFFGPPALRVAHGLLFAVGCVALLAAMPRRRRARPTVVPTTSPS